MEKKTPSRARRFILASVALAMLGGHALSSGCAAGFAPISNVDGLRVLAVQADKPYAKPGDKVTFEMTYWDGFVDPADPEASRQINVVWLGGCFDPPGDAYYGCYASLGTQLGSLFSADFNPATDIPKLLATGLFGIGDRYTLTLPEDIVSRRPKPTGGAPYYGIAYVFFLACAGEIRPVPQEGTGAAGSFPIGCFKTGTNERLGQDSFVPGYTQVYAFADGRTNENPVVTGMSIDGKRFLKDDIIEVEACPITADERLGPPGCGRADPSKDCKNYEIDITLPEDDGLVAEIDPDARQPDGTNLRESVWVDYFADKGSFNAPIKLVSDAVEGVQDSHSVDYSPPADAGPVRIWAVVHDARGGQRVVTRNLRVK